MAAKTDNEQIIQLINKQIDGQALSMEEQQVLNTWLAVSENNSLYKRLTNKELLLKKRFEYDEYNVEKAWQAMDKRISPRINFKRWISYAAAVLVPLVLFYTVYQLSHIPEVNDSHLSETIQPGEKKAVLILSDGQQVELSAADTTLQMIGSGTSIAIDSLGAVYQDSNSVFANKRYNTVKTARGMEYNLTLADGTKVWINSESSLRYPENFAGNTREVYATGEVFLEVAKNEEKPFFVHFNNKKVEVLGTAFNVRTYTNEKVDIVTLVEGSIALSTGTQKVLMKPDKQAIVDAQNQLQLLDVDASLYAAWKEGRFVYKNTPLDRIVTDLARWYDCQIFYQNPDMKNERFSLNTNRQEDINQILEALALTQTVQFKVKGKNIVIQSVN